MYDLSSKFNTFYRDHVVLPQDDQDELFEKKNLNVQRLKDGLDEYNSEHSTNYEVVETCVQGSVAMSTVVQNENNEYDIDVAIVFDKTALGDKGAKAIRNIVADALRRKTKQFNVEPTVKTSCVRVNYADGYHIDFAVFRREMDLSTQDYKYEHAGEEWTSRELKGLNDWFMKQNDDSGGALRKVVRLSKMFCKSREEWKNMPSGLLQTVLCYERLEKTYTRIDELFYHTMRGIVDRLESDTSVSAPVDNGRNLTPRQKDLQKMINWKNRLKSKLDDLRVLFNDDCTLEDALQAWQGFFLHDYWAEQVSEAVSCNFSLINKPVISVFSDTEEFIEDKFQTCIRHTVNVICFIRDGWGGYVPISDFFTRTRRYVPYNCSIKCQVLSTTVPDPYEVWWKVKNVGPEAQRRNCVRGQILNRGSEITENAEFYGNHYIECYIVKERCCVARRLIHVPIGRRFII